MIARRARKRWRTRSHERRSASKSRRGRNWRLGRARRLGISATVGRFVIASVMTANGIGRKGVPGIRQLLPREGRAAVRRCLAGASKTWLRRSYDPSLYGVISLTVLPELRSYADGAVRPKHRWPPPRQFRSTAASAEKTGAWRRQACRGVPVSPGRRARRHREKRTARDHACALPACVNAGNTFTEQPSSCSTSKSERLTPKSSTAIFLPPFQARDFHR